MVFPNLQPWIEQWRDGVRLRIDAREVWAFVQIAMVTSQSEVCQIIAAAVLAGDNMLDVEREEGIIVLMKSAILAVVGGSIPDEIGRRRVWHEESNIARYAADGVVRSLRALA